MRKKLLLTVLISFAAHNFLSAQTAAADSLNKILKAHPTIDTIRVNLLNQLAKEIRRGKPKQADSVADLAISISEQLNYKKGKGNALAIKGAIYTVLMNHMAAKKAYAEGKELLSTVGDKSGESFLLRMEAN